MGTIGKKLSHRTDRSSRDVSTSDRPAAVGL